MADPRPTPRTISMPLAGLIAVGALVVGVLLGVAFGGSDEGSVSIRLPSPSVTTGSPVPTTSPSAPTPTASPGNGSVSTGQATLSLTGGINTQVTFGRLASGAVWSVPPGEIALTWQGSGDQFLQLEGPSFSSQIATDAAHPLSFTVIVDGVPIAFRSAAGECTVTISPALPTQMGGTFLCTNLPSTDGGTTVNGQGSFSASG